MLLKLTIGLISRSFPMLFKIRSFACLTLVCSVAASSSALFAQSSIQLFGPVDVRLSQAGTGYGSNAVVFNSTTLNLTCPAAPITAVLSSSADGTGNIIVDNNINLTVTSNGSTTGPTNICVGGVNGSQVGPLENCFTEGLEALGSAGSLTGQDPDNFVATGGVAPIDISQSLVPGAEQVKIDLVDQGSGNGFYLSSSTLYLNTNCTQGGVTGPALVSGNPIAQNPTPDQLSQDFSFNPVVNQQIGFTYDLTQAYAANSLTVTDGTIPQVADSPLDPALYLSQYVPQTSFATSMCLVHSGELLPNGQPACKLFTLQCKVGTGATATGAQCPVSAMNNELFQDSFDGPAFTLPDIQTPNGPTFHQGVGFLMANEGWTGGPCTFDPEANLQSLPCPQNLLSSFASGIADSANVRKANGGVAKAAAKVVAQPIAAATTSTGSYVSTGRTTHPNSTFITVAQVPEDLTTVTVAGQKPGYWINSSTASVTLSSQPPNLSGTTLPGAASFVASPIQSITYGISPAGSVPVPGDSIPTDTVLSSGVVCPTQANPTGQPAGTFTPDPQVIQNLADGSYLVHYYAQDCAGTEELKFNQSGGNWSTSFYTFPINVDTTAPVVASGPTLSPAASAQGTYNQYQSVMASFSCTDAFSGVVSCGGQTFAAGTTSTGPLTATVDTSSVGAKTFTVVAIDAAGNQSSQAVNYQVVSPYDSQIQFSINPQTVSYPSNANVTIQIAPIGSTSNVQRSPIVSAPVRLNAIRSGAVGANSSVQTPTGTVQVLDGKTKLATLTLFKGAATYNLRGLNVGAHSISIAYSGDAHNPAGVSAPVSFTVTPASVALHVDCYAATLTYGQDYVCGLWATSPGSIPGGVATYTYDNGPAKTIPLFFGIGAFYLPKPAIGQHTVVVSYAAQTNYAAAPPQTEKFTVVQPPTKTRP
jgi:hypothetical protein